MKIEVRIEAQLEELWAQLGLSENEQDQEYEKLNKQVQELFRTFLKSVYEEVQNAKNEAEQAEQAVVDHISRFDLEVHGNLDKNLPFRQRIQNANIRLATLQKATAEQQQEYDDAFNALTKAYDILEIIDRGEFQEKGSNFSLDKIDRMNDIIDELNEQIEARQPQIDNLCSQITQLNRDIGIPPQQIPQTCGDMTIANLQNILEETKTKREQNIENVKELGSEIRRIERILKIRPTTNTSVSVCSDEIIQTFTQKLEQLETQKQNRISEYLEGLRSELHELWVELHISIPLKAEFPFYYKTDPNKRTLIALESEVKRLENLRNSISPLLDLLAQRNAILQQQEIIKEGENDPNRYGNRQGASQFLSEERTKRRIQNELPKIHSKLIKELEEYENTYGEPFIWDGKNILLEVREMHKNEEASKLQSQIRSKKVDTSRRKNGKTVNLSQRAPFQLQEYLI